MGWLGEEFAALNAFFDARAVTDEWILMFKQFRSKPQARFDGRRYRYADIHGTLPGDKAPPADPSRRASRTAV